MKHIIRGEWSPIGDVKFVEGVRYVRRQRIVTEYGRKFSLVNRGRPVCEWVEEAAPSSTSVSETSEEVVRAPAPKRRRSAAKGRGGKP